MSDISQAVKILRSGGLVAFPTETVYGLGADAANPAAVKRLFAAKGRPATNPLIVHVADATVARRYAAEWPLVAESLSRDFWPGPLTLVVKKLPTIGPEVTAGRDTVGLRAPDHPLALELLRQFAGAIAAPSANRSSRVSPTTTEHVRGELGDAVDLILDGGPCRVGIESTVLDLSVSPPKILRLGAIRRREIESRIGAVDLFSHSIGVDQSANSPGQQAVHYAPSAPAYRFTDREIHKVMDWLRIHRGGMAVVLWIGKSDAFEVTANMRLIRMPETAEEYARRLYAALHEADVEGVGAIFVQTPPDGEAWAAVRDRVARGTTPV
jgi:L-threonylcarbamoyladenylate synthase